MPEFKGGVEEAAKMLQGLDTKARQRVLEDIAKRDPEMAEKLKKNMVLFEDLIHLTRSMMIELLRHIDLATLGKALRMGSAQLKDHFLSNVSSGMAEEINETLKGKPVAANDVQEAVDEVMLKVLHLIDQGKIVLSENDDYV